MAAMPAGAAMRARTRRRPPTARRTPSRPTPASTRSGPRPADAEKLVADSPGGGFVPAPPAGSECNYGAQRYTVEIATRAFSFQRCTAGATATDPLELVKGGRTLTAGELATNVFLLDGGRGDRWHGRPMLGGARATALRVLAEAGI